METIKTELTYYGAMNGSDFTIVKTEPENGYQKKIATVHFDHAGIMEANNPTEATRYVKLFTKAPEMAKENIKLRNALDRVLRCLENCVRHDEDDESAMQEARDVLAGK